jgi:hypothetical protein
VHLVIDPERFFLKYFLGGKEGSANSENPINVAVPSFEEKTGRSMA